jgi:PAS domain S-box-containing protein
MNDAQPNTPDCAERELIRLPGDVFLETFPEGACLIGADFRIREINSELKRGVGAKPGDICYESLAGRSDICPFCKFYELVSGETKSLPATIHVRKDKACSINLKSLPNTDDGCLILETVRCLTEDQTFSDEERNRGMLPLLLRKLTGLLVISRGLMANRPFSEKMAHVIEAVHNVLEQTGLDVWIELDDQVYGKRVADPQGQRFRKTIIVGAEDRGAFCVHWPEKRHIPPEEIYFLEEAANLIDRQVEINDLWALLSKSEEKFKRLAHNLSKEMWNRTEALVQDRAYLEGILRSSEDMIITTDLDGRVVQFNPGAERLLEYTAEEIHGRPIAELWVNAEERDKLMDEVLHSGGISNFQTLLRAKSGEIKEISLSLSMLKDVEGRILGTVGISKDIGKENAIRRELERLNENFREAIHFINHETKNSLIVMGGFLRRLLQSETDPGRKDQLRIVYHHSKFLEAMSRDFLVMAELEHGQFQVRKKTIHDLYKEVILPAMMGLKERYPDSFLYYDASMGGVGAVKLNADPALLEIVYRNLFGNALKYRDPDRKIAYGVQDHGDKYLFNVWNEGPGVPLREKENIFKKFYRVHDDTTRDKRGTGLGLYNIKRIIEAHNGRIWCETRPGEWINFLFELPKE